MALFLEDLKAYLASHGIEPTFCDHMLDQPDECVGLFVWSHAVPEINDGTGTRYVQIQARSKDPDVAYATAHKVAALLDSGVDEELIYLTDDRWVIARLRNLPRKLHVDEDKRFVYYFDVALFGANKP